MVERMMFFWRDKLTDLIGKVSAQYPPGIPIESDHVADHILTTFEGAFILARVMNEPKLAAEQLIRCRHYLDLFFEQSL